MEQFGHIARANELLQNQALDLALPTGRRGAGSEQQQSEETQQSNSAVGTR